MPVLVLNAAEFVRYHQQLAERFYPAALRGVHSGAARAIAQVLVPNTRTAPPANPAGVGSGGAVNTGQFLRGWRWKPIDRGAALFNIASHAPFVDGGRNADRKPPPLRAIVLWAIRRLGLSEAEAKRAAFPIARAISRRGLIGRNILKGGTEEIMRLVTLEVAHELEREMRRPPRR